MDIPRDIAQLQDAEIRAHMERDAPRTVSAAFGILASLLAMRHRPATLADGQVAIEVDGTAISLRVEDHTACISMANPGERPVEARVRSLPALECLFADTVATARRLAPTLA